MSKPTLVVEMLSRHSSKNASFIASLGQTLGETGQQAACVPFGSFYEGRSAQSAEAVSLNWVKYLEEGNEQADGNPFSLIWCEYPDESVRETRALPPSVIVIYLLYIWRNKILKVLHWSQRVTRRRCMYSLFYTPFCTHKVITISVCLSPTCIDLFK